MRRALRLAFAPVRYATLRPLRAAGYLLLVLLVAAGLAATGTWVWFNHHLGAARSELARGHNAAALAHLNRCRLIRPDDAEVMLLSARVARRSGSLDEAEALLDRYAEQHGQDEGLVLERLLLRTQRGELEETGPAVLARVRAGGPDATLCREALVTGMLYRFLWADADRYLDEWVSAEPDSTAALLLRGKLEEQRLATAVALEKYRRVVELDPDHDEARLRLATLYMSNRRGNEALEHLAVLRGRFPDHAEVAVLWARALALQGRHAESRAALADCLARHPDYAPALSDAGDAALVDGDEPEAERLLARAVALDPGDTITRLRYASALARNGKRAEADREQERIKALGADRERVIALLSGPLQERPNDPQVPYEIAQIAQRSGEIREAVRWYSAALRADPGHVPSHQALTRLYHDMGNPVLAARHRALAHGRSPAPAKP
jgi:predicted Zn-dependent protease